MKIIFLDIDGVLNNTSWFKSREACVSTATRMEYDLSNIDPNSVIILNEIINATEAKVVISSTWRKTNSVKYLQELLEKKGFTGEIIDKTGVLYFRGIEGYNYSVPRGCEIKAWLEINKGILGDKISKVKYAILDDDSDMLYWQRENYFRVDPYCGLTSNVAYRVINFLNK